MLLDWRRLRVSDVLMLLAGVCCLIGAVVLGARNGPAILLLLASFGIVCASVGALSLFTRPPRGQIQLAEPVVDGRPARAFVVGPALAKHRLTFVGCVGFVVLGVGLVGSSAPEERVIGVLTLLFFGVGALALAPGTLGVGGEQLVLTPAGVQMQGTFGNAMFVPWVELRDLDVINIRGTRFIGARVRNPSDLKTSRLGRLVMLLNRAVVGSEVSFSTTGLALSTQALLGVLTYYVEFPEERPDIGTHAGLSRLEAALATLDRA